MTEETHDHLVSPFDAIRHQQDPLGEYWSAHELARLLGYTEFGKFKKALERAEKSCEQSGQAVTDHFAHVSDMVSIGSGAKRRIEDVYLTRYAAYLVVQNADSSKPIVALGQQYFAIQTRKQELAEEEQRIELTEPQLRLLRRAQMSLYNNQLAGAAYQAGVITSRDFSTFQDHGYIGLYKERARDIHRCKKLPKGQEILDYMHSDELATNIFRASQTKQKLERENVSDKQTANQVHFDVGRAIRHTIQDLGGTLPEAYSTPEKSIQQVEREEQERQRLQLQPPLFELFSDDES